MRYRKTEPTPILLPPAWPWRSADEVEQFALLCLRICGLTDWTFAWDRAMRRLGSCRIKDRCITLSGFFVAAYIERDTELIRHAILHELAHALAWTHGRETGHGAVWHSWCVALGIPDAKSVYACDSFAPARAESRRYALCHADTGEVYRYYSRRPRLSEEKLSTYYIAGKKKETLGKLRLISLQNDAPEARK